MGLIVETGSIVANANSYVDLVGIKSYASLRGVTLGSDTVIEQQAIKAVDYLESFRSEYQGGKVSSAQCLQFPRYPVSIDGFEVSETTIPNILVKAQCQLVCEQANGIDILPTQTESAIKKEVVGPVEVEYAVSDGAIVSPRLNAVDALVAPLFKTASFGLSVVRV